MDIETYRKDFPLIYNQDGVYLDSAATAHKPQQVINRMQSFYEKEYATVNRGVYCQTQTATSLYHQVREKAQVFLGANSSSEIVFTKGTTESINLIASSFGEAFLQKGDEVLILETEHHANIVPWQKLRDTRGIILRVIPVNDQGELDFSAFEELLSSKTKLVCLAHISNTTGAIHPIKQVAEKAHEKGAYVLVDGAQSAPHKKIDVTSLDCDFFVFSSHKCFGPTGLGVLYGKKEILEKMPPYQMGGDMVDTVTFEKTTYQLPPSRFEAGTPMIAQVIGFGAALDYLNQLDFDLVHKHEEKLLEQAMIGLQKIEGISFIGSPEKRASLISFVVDGVHPLDLGSFLDFKKIAIRTGHLCSQTTMSRFGVEGCSRISFAFYNTLEEVFKFQVALEEVIKNLKSTIR